MANAKQTYLGWGMGAGSAGFGLFLLNQTTDALEFVFQVQPDAASFTITRLGFRQGTLTGVAPVFRVSLQGVDASGNPDGVIKNATNAFVDYTPTAGNNSTWQWVTLGATYAASPGEFLAIVIAYQSGTIDASNNCSFTTTHGLSYSSGTAYAIQNDAGVRSRLANSPNFGWGTAGQAYGSPAETIDNGNWNSGSTPDEKALLFSLPATWGSTYKVAGLRWTGNWASGTANTTAFVLYDTDGTTELQNISQDPDQDRTNGANTRSLFFDEATLATLVFGSTYRLAIRPGASNVSINVMTMDAAADLEAWPMGSFLTYSSRTNAGAWTDDAASRPSIELILDHIVAPAGGVFLRRGGTVMKM